MNTESVSQDGESEIVQDFRLIDSLYDAAQEGCTDKFRRHANLLDQILTPYENTILHIYITVRPSPADQEETHTTNFVREILEMCPGLLWKANSKGETLLHMAARHGHADIVKSLIAECKMRHQNDPEEGDGGTRIMLEITNEERDTALHEAVRYNHVDIVKILIQEDPDLSYDANKAGETPLYLASERGHYKVAKQIVTKCKSPADRGPLGRSALHAAVIRNSKAMTKLLLDTKGSSTRKKDEQGWVPLHYAAYFGYLTILKLLLRADKLAAYKADNEGKTALHVAISCKKKKTMEEIISECPACSEIVDKKGWNAFHFALDAKNWKAVRNLLKNRSLGNLINQKNVEGNTPLLQLAASETYYSPFVLHRKVDKLVYNHQHFNAADIISAEKSPTFPEKIFIRNLGSHNVKPGRRNILEKDKVGQRDEGKVISSKGDQRRKERGVNTIDYILEETKNAHLVVATLIATVSFAAGITLPGGYFTEKGEDQGTPVLSKSRAFQAFVIFNTIALTLSSTSVFRHLFLGISSKKRLNYLRWRKSLRCTHLALAAMVLAFLTGTYAALYRAKEVAIATSVITALFFWTYFLARPYNFRVPLVQEKQW